VDGVSPPRVSVAVSTYQRAGLLPGLVAALEAQTLPAHDFEVVITDNGATDDTAAVLARLVTESPLHITVVAAAENRGPAAGRNLAWRAARAPIVAFTDDDCDPTPRWLQQGLELMESTTRRVVVGRTRPPPEDEHLTSGPFSRTVRVDDARLFPTCNVWFLRADLDESGGFDETFDEPAGEDTDLGLRVTEAGAQPMFGPDALVYHRVRPSDFRATVRETLRWTGIPLVIAKHPHRRDLLYRRVFWKESHPVALLAASALLVAPRHPAVAAAMAAPYTWYRTRRAPLCPGPRRRWAALPGALAIDLLEVVVMVRGSLRARTLVL
jgi:glycosyltransferase involved in cell wall biosynthesis